MLVKHTPVSGSKMAARSENVADEEEAKAPLPEVSVCRALIDRVAGSSHFARSARLRDFLLYVGHESLKPNAPEIHEQEIGVRVFGRSASYDRSQDNIVRVNATELRRRIETYFATEGATEPLVFSIPRGGYLPVFRWRTAPAENTFPSQEQPELPTSTSKVEAHPVPSTPRIWLLTGLCGVLALACGILLWQNYGLRKKTDLWAERPAAAAFWTSFAQAAPQTDIVLPDASVSMSEEMRGKPLSLSDYLDRNYIHRSEEMTPDRRQDLETIFNHNLVTLGDFHAAQQILNLEPIAPRLHLILARFFEADSLKRNNIILIGGKKANPWARLFDEQLNFSLEYDGVHSQAYVKNRSPLAGEDAQYAPVMDRNAITAYCVVDYLPNPGRTGKAILLAGTDSDATAAAAEFLTSEKGILSLRTRTGSKEIPYFEAVLKTSRLSGTSFNAELLAIRSFKDR